MKNEHRGGQVTKKRKIMKEEGKAPERFDPRTKKKKKEKNLNKRKRGRINGGTERKLTEADEGTPFDFAGKLKTSTNGIVCSVFERNKPVLLNQLLLKLDSNRSNQTGIVGPM